MNGKYSNYVLSGMRNMFKHEGDDDVDDDVDDDKIIEINDNSYTLSKKNLLTKPKLRISRNTKQFKRTDKNGCFIEFSFERSEVWIDY